MTCRLWRCQGIRECGRVWLSLSLFVGSQHELTCNDTRHVLLPSSSEAKVQALHGREPCISHCIACFRVLRIYKTNIPN